MSKEKQPDAAKGTDVALKQGTALQTVDFGEDAGSGLANVTAAELKIPFLNLLQPLSPQVKPVTAGGMPGAKAGMLLNGGTGELYDLSEKPMQFMPVWRDHKYLEFTPRNLGGGFVAMYEPDDEKILRMVQQQGKFGKLTSEFPAKRNEKGELMSGTEIMETFSLYGLFFDDVGNATRAIVSFKSTQIKKYQGFMGRVTGIKYGNPKSTAENPLPAIMPPLWAHLWDLKTVFETKGENSWYGYQLSLHAKKADGSEDVPFASLVARTDERYLAAKAFYEMLKEGKAQADFSTDNKAGDVDAGGKAGQNPGDPPM